MADLVEAAAAVEPTEPAPESTSLAEHQDIFGPQDPTLDAEAKKTNDEARAKVRHRAQSQQAAPKDAPRIAELTRKLREAEAENVRLKQPAPPPARVDQSLGTAVPAAGEAGAARQAAPVPPTREKPHVDKIGAEGGYDTYEAYIEDLADWKHEQRDAARDAAQQQAQQARQQSESQQLWAKAHATYAERLTAFKATHADYDTLLTQHGTVQIPAAPIQAILGSESGPAWAYHLMQHPDQLAELALLFDGKAPTDAMVAHATRWLSSRATPPVVAPAAAPALALAPKPPNPVRTGAARTDNEGPSDDSMSISDHEKAYGRGRRR